MTTQTSNVKAPKIKKVEFELCCSEMPDSCTERRAQMVCTRLLRSKALTALNTCLVLIPYVDCPTRLLYLLIARW